MNTKTKLLSALKQSPIENLDLKIEQLILFKELCLKWNTKYNLFSKGDTDRFDERHLLDSLTPIIKSPELIETTTWLDMGCGTGFPILPLSIVLDKAKFCGVEPRSKRVLILNTFRRELDLQNINFHVAKAEELDQGLFDIVSCRALGSLSEDWDRAQKHLIKDGSFITFKTNGENFDIPNTKSTPYQWDLDSDPYQLIQIRNA